MTSMNVQQNGDVIRRDQMPRLFDGNVSLGRLGMLRSTRRKIDGQIARKGPVVCASVDSQGRALLLTNDAGVAQAVMDEQLFTKRVTTQTTLQWEVRSVLGEGLLTSSTDDEVWQRARKIMNPVFAKQATQLHFQAMCSAATEASRTLSRHADSGTSVELMPFAVRATLHSILIALFGHHSDLYAAHPSSDFALSAASQVVVEQCVARTYYPKAFNRLRRSEKRWRTTEHTFHQRLGAFVEQRYKERDGKHQDILQCMLDAGMGEDYKHMIQQLMLLIIAGHETTGSSIAYLLYTLAQHPAMQERVAIEAQQAGLGDEDLTGVDVSTLSRLPYTDMVINESMRLNPSATALVRVARHDQTVTATDGRRYEVRAGDMGSVMLSSLHRNEHHWPDPGVFRPERFAKGIDNRHAYAFLPFAAGARSCLGRAFALQELRLFTAVFAMRFHFARRMRSLWHRSMRHYYGFTMKPIRAHVLVSRRTSASDVLTTSSTSTLFRSSMDDTVEEAATPVKKSMMEDPRAALPIVQVAYGSNHGQCRAMAFELQQVLTRLGFATHHDSCALDAIVDTAIPSSSLLFVVASTYNGQPPDNAMRFRDSIRDGTLVATRNLQYAVFGAGNAEWRATLHAFPRLVDEALSGLGGQRLVPIGVGDADENLEADWRVWLRSVVAQLADRFPVCRTSPSAADFVKSLATGSFAVSTASLGVQWLPVSAAEAFGRVDANALPVKSIEELQQTTISGRSTLKVMLDLATPLASSSPPYHPGDHLLLWPQNSADSVEIVAAALCVGPDDVFSIQFGTSTTLNPALAATHLTRPTKVRDFLQHSVNLLGRPTRATVANVCARLQRHARYAQADTLAAALDDDNQWQAFLRTHATTNMALCLHVADSAPLVLTFEDWLAVWPQMQSRSYSIASDARSTARILVSIQDDGQMGITLRRLKEGKTKNALLFGTIRPSTFRLVKEQEHAVFIAAGTGLAPFLSFLQRFKRDANSRPVGSVTLIYGSRGPYDVLCADELQSYRDDGVLTQTILAQSRVDTHDARYVGDCIRNNAAAMASRLQDPTTVFYICGSASTMALNAHEALQLVLQEELLISSEEAKQHIVDMRSSGRLHEDTWG